MRVFTASASIKTFLFFFLCTLHSVNAQVDSSRFNQLSDSLLKYQYQDTDKALIILNKMDVLTRSAPKSVYRIKYLNELGGRKRMERDIASAMIIYKEAVSKSRAIKDERLLIRSTINMATAYGDAGQVDVATKILRELEERMNKTGEDHGFRKTLYANLTTSYSVLNEMESAYKYNDLLKTVLETKRDSLMYYLTRFGLLEIDKKYKETIKMGSEALSKVKGIDNHFLYQYYFYMGQAYLKLNNYEKGSKYLFKAKEIEESLSIESSTFYSIFADYFMGVKDYRKAILYYDKLKSVSTSEGSLVMYIEALNGLSSSYEKIGEYKKGLEIKNQLFALTDSLNGIERRKAILDLDAKYELKEKQRTIEQQKTESSLQQELLKVEERRRNTFAILLIASMFFLGLAIYLLRRIKKDRVRIINQRNEIEGYSQTLEETNKMKDKLFAVISHDLRSPISSLANTLTLYNEDKQSKPLQDTLISLSNIQLILSNLLNWANLQIRDSEPAFSDVNVSSLLASVVSQVETQAKAKSIDILSAYTDTGEVYTDEHFLQIVLRNILTNAIKFTPEGGFIRIDSVDADSGVQLIIRDSGVGMSEKQLETIFAYPASSKGTIGEKGTGLGLTLCKELLDKVEGTITVKSKVGIGTEMRILVPRKM